MRGHPGLDNGRVYRECRDNNQGHALRELGKSAGEDNDEAVAALARGQRPKDIN